MSTPLLASPPQEGQTNAEERTERPAFLSTFNFRLSTYGLALIVLVSALTTALAMRRTSTTFDEIVFIAGGARGYETGRWDIAPEHPPLMQYIYGLPVYLSRPEFPDESSVSAEIQRQMGYRYFYAQRFFFEGANDPERVAFLGRLPAVAFVSVLVGLVFFFVSRKFGIMPAVLAALLAGFLPDVLAHGGVAYNDVPLAVAVFGAVWAMDAAARKPTAMAGAITGVLLAFALGIKFSAVVLVPIGAMILLLEGFGRREDRRWLQNVGRCAMVAAFVAYVVLVIIYRGDVALAEFRYGLDFTFRHVSEGHGAPGYMFGEFSRTGWWYFFPVAFLFKTPVALHALMLVGFAGLLIEFRDAPRRLLTSPLRGPLTAITVLAAALLTSNLVIGFRYALPILPLVCVVTAVSVATVWSRVGTVVRKVIAVTALWFVASSLSYYPNFLAYVSEYGPGRDREHEVLLDSSVDWGQGLLALRQWMEAEEIDAVYLSYFGSARPEGYGIRYAPLASFFQLPPQDLARAGIAEPTHAVISATNLHGVYLAGDPFARFRSVQPDTVLAHTLFVYKLR
jgi:hypothetical protein